MSVKSRINKLEKVKKQKSGPVGPYIVFTDDEAGIMSIPRLNFKGTIAEGERLIADDPNGYLILPGYKEEWCC